VTQRLLILAALAGAGLLGMLALRLYRSRGRATDWLDVSDVGLELMADSCAFVVFTTPACGPCKPLIEMILATARDNGGEIQVRNVDATERTELASRYDIRSVPTTFLITASGHVVASWTDRPSRPDVEAALALVHPPATAGMIDTVASSETAVERPSRNRTSSSLT
jgi:thiol-disulfide isomerase/thioredoxin